MCAVLESHRRRGRSFSIVVVAAGAAPARGTAGGTRNGPVHGGAYRVAEQIAARLGVGTRVTVPGNFERGGSPTAFDRILATRFGIRAADLVREGKLGQIAAIQGTRVVAVSLDEATAGPKRVDLEQFADAEVLVG